MNTPTTVTTWTILFAKDLDFFFDGTYDQFEDCYGGIGLPPDATDDAKEADIVGWALRWNAREAATLRVCRRVDNHYSLPPT